MKKIDKYSKVFEMEEFKKDKYKFNLIFKMLESDTALFYSDLDSYIIGRGTLGYPTWVWTKDLISYDKVLEIEKLMELYLTDNEKDKFTCKKELYDYLVKDNYEFLNLEDYFEMGYLDCSVPKKPKDTDGNIDKIDKSEMGLIAGYWYNSCIEMQDIDLEPITMEEAMDDVINMYNSGNLYVWRDDFGKIVCMGYYSVNSDQAKISHVYTPVESRGKGYAANLVYEMTKKILDLGLVPLLYTDYKYAASNKAYINAGYEDKGILINFTCSKSKKLVK